VILKFGGEPIDSSAELPPKVAAVAPGTAVVLEVWHDGKTRKAEVTVGEQKTAQAVGEEAEATDTARLGVAVRPLGPEERAQTGTGEGLLVLDASGPAARAGIREGDVILALNGRPVATADALRQALEGAGRHVALLIQREDARIFVPIELG
jgi:serine protease Do